MIRLSLYREEMIQVDFFGDSDDWRKLRLILNRLDTRKRVKDEQGNTLWIFHFSDFPYFKSRLDRIEFPGPRRMSVELKAALDSWWAEVKDLEKFRNLNDFDLSFFGDPGLGEGYDYYPHQKAGIAFLLKSYFLGVNPLLADEQGLGKTLQVLRTAHILGLYDEIKNCWIFCPKTIMKTAWGNDARKFTGRPVTYVEGGVWQRREIWANDDTFFKIANYEAGRQDSEFLQALIKGEALKVKVGRLGVKGFIGVKEYYVTEREISNIVGLEKDRDGNLKPVYQRLEEGDMFVGYAPRPLRPTNPDDYLKWKQEVADWNDMVKHFSIPKEFWGKYLLDVEPVPAVFVDMRVVDEAHRIKNHAAERTKAIKAIRTQNGDRGTFIVNTTGTPILNRLVEAWSIYDDLQPGYLGTNNHFKEKYTISDGWGNVSEYKNTEELREKIQRFMLRRRKDEVTDLPEKVYQTLHVHFSPEERKWYDKLADEFEVWLSSEVKVSAINRLAQMTRFKQLCDSVEILSGKPYISSKMRILIEDLEEILEVEPGRKPRKAVIFTQYVAMLKILARELRDYGVVGIWGDTPNDRSSRQERLLEQLREANPGKSDWELIMEYNASIEEKIAPKMSEYLSEMREARRRQLIRDYLRKNFDEYVDDDTFQEVLREFLPESPTEDEIIKAKNDALRELMSQLLSNETVISEIEDILRDIITQELEAITEEDVTQRHGIRLTRTDIVDRFQEDPNVRIFIGQYEACGVGITLTAADTVYLYDKTWVPADGKQAEDRCHRIGTTGTVTVKDLEVVDSIEERLRMIWESKQDLFDSFVESERVLTKLGKSDLLWIIRGGTSD